jgi:hypothetical protein
MLVEELPRDGTSGHDSSIIRVQGATPPRILALLLVCLILVCLPVLVTATPPIGDYPNHLGRAHILAHWQNNKLFQEVFALDSLLLPNVLTDIWIATLSGWIGTLAAGQALLLLILALTFVGAFALNYAATKQLSTWPLIVGLFLYNEVFFMGFLNYLLGIALLLWGCAAWLLFEPRSRRGQWITTAFFAPLILFSHLVAFGLFTVAIAVLEMEALWRRRREGAGKLLVRTVTTAMAFAPTILVYVIASPTRNLPFVVDFEQSDFLFKKLSPFTRILSSGNAPLDLVILGGAVLIVLATFLLRSITLEQRLSAIAAAFVFLVLILPWGTMGSYFLDARVAAPSVILFLSALRPRNHNGSQGALGLVAVLILLALRSGGLMLDWQATGREYAAILEGIRQLPEGTLVIPAVSWKVPYAKTWFLTSTHQPPLIHFANYATVLRGSVVSNVFAKRGQNPVVLKPSSKAFQIVADFSDLRVETDDALQTLAVQSSAVRQTDPVFATRGVHLLLLGVTCDRWQATIPLPPFYCGGAFSIVAIPAEFAPSTSYSQPDQF